MTFLGPNFRCFFLEQYLKGGISP
uniref:Uncharacterized protein n=1 Tax=Arundo donax TaxID=35708 RepID=A0A0A9AK92_ARUDO